MPDLNSHTPPLPPPEQLASAMQSIDVMAQWLSQSGLSDAAIAQWKYNSLATTFPALSNLVESAKSLIGTTQPIPETGLTVTELATALASSLQRKTTPTDVNTALVKLGLQIRKEKERVWELTEAGQEYGQALLATSKTNNWSGTQVKWFKSVIPLLEDYFHSIPVEEQSSSQKVQATAKNSTKNTSKKTNSNSTEATREYWFIEDRLKHLKKKANANQLIHIEMYAVDAYKGRHGKSPSKQQYKNSQASAYPVADTDLLDAAIEKVISKTPTAATKSN